jgi:hypothetical protein
MIMLTPYLIGAEARCTDGACGQGHGKVVKWGCELLFHSSG